MKSKEKYVSSDSDYYIYSPSMAAYKTFFYPICTGFFHYEAGYELFRNSYASYLILYIHRGELVVRENTNIQVARAGHFVLIDCYQPHGYSTETGCECTWVHFDGPMAKQYFQLIRENCSTVFMLADGYSALNPLEKIYRIFHQKEKIREPLISQWLSDILTSILLNSSQTAPLPRYLQLEETITYIHEHFDQTLSIDQLAKKALLSPYHFIRVFKKETGYTPHEYIINIRINTAKYLLKSTSLSIKKITYTVGFTSESSFCTAFKKKIGFTPLEYRKKDITI